MILFECVPVHGRLRMADGESIDLQWFRQSQINQISGFGNIDFQMLVRQEDEQWLTSP